MDPSLAAQLVGIARRSAARGWAPATSGNFSVRMPGGRVWITPSGADKGALEVDQLLELGPDGKPLHAERVASAETGLHLARYAADPRVGAVVHVHSSNAVLISRRVSRAVEIEGFELLKAFPGFTSHEVRMVVPVIDNHQDMGVLAPIAERAIVECAPTWGYLLRGHGLYTWGADPGAAERHAEALDVLFHYLLQEAR